MCSEGLDVCRVPKAVSFVASVTYGRQQNVMHKLIWHVNKDLLSPVCLCFFSFVFFIYLKHEPR